MSLSLDFQIKYFKGSKKSICQNCDNYNKDCDKAFKTCETDRSTGYSMVVECNSFNGELNKSYNGKSISALSSESRVDMMGGGYQNMEKYKKQEG